MHPSDGFFSIIVEFIADLNPNSGILPSDAVQRAKARFFVDQVNHHIVEKYAAHVARGAPAAALVTGAEAIQALLPLNKKFALGDKLTIADIALIPFLIRGEVLFSFDDPENVWRGFQSEKLSRFWQYFQDLKAHPAVQSTFDEDVLRSFYAKRFAK
jgi:glutathione S-transferase